MKRYKRLFAMLLAVLTVLSLAACSKIDTPVPKDDAATQPSLDVVTQPLPDVDTEESKDTEAEPQEPFVMGTVTPCLIFDFNSEFLCGNVFEGLLRIKEGSSHEVEGVLAESWEVSSDGLEWRFKIKDGVYFSNGVLCDAGAIAECFEMTSNIYNAFPAGNPVRMSAEEGNVLVFKLYFPIPDFEYILCREQLLIAEKSTLEHIYTADYVAGTGPYVTDGPDENYCWQLRRRSDYHGEAAQIETVEVRYFAAEEEMAQKLIEGELDYAAFKDTALFDTLLESCGSEASIEYDGANPIFMNPHSIEHLELKEVRRALSLLIDPDRVNEDAFGGYGRVQTSIWTDGSPIYVSAGERKYDPELGLELLSSVGIAPGDIEFTNYTWDEMTAAGVYHSICDQLTQAGMNITQEHFKALGGFVPTMNDKWALFSFYTRGSAFDAKLTLEYTLTKNSLVPINIDAYGKSIEDAIMGEYEAMMSAARGDEMIEHCKNLTQILQDEYIVYPSVQTPVLVVRSGEYEGYETGAYHDSLDFSMLGSK